MVNFPLFDPFNILGTRTKKSEISSDPQELVPFGNLTKVKGGGQISYIEGSKDYSTTNIYPQSQSGEIIIQTKKELNTDATSQQNQEKPQAYSLIGGSAGSGESKVGGSNVLTYALIGAGVLVGGYLVLKK